MASASLDNRIYIYRINQQNILIDVNDAWVAFALENDAPTLVRENVVGKSLWGFIDGWETRHIFDLILEGLRKDRLIIRIPFRCDSPILRRFMEMEIHPLPRDEVEFRCRVLREEARSAVELLRPGGTGPLDVFICTWCKKLRVDETLWEEAETAVRTLKLFAQNSRPKLHNQICPDCRKNLMHALKVERDV